LEFKIEKFVPAELLARIARKEGTERVGVAFIGSHRDLNAIQLYVLGV